MVVAIVAAAVPSAASASPKQTPPPGAGRGGVDYQQGEMHFGADSSAGGGGATVGAEADIRLDALVPTTPAGGDGSPTYAGPPEDGGGGSGSNAGAPYRCRYVATGRESSSGLIEMSRNCGTAARSGLGGGWYQTLDIVFADPAAPAAEPEPATPVALVDPAVLATSARRSLSFPPPVPRSSPSLETGTYAQLPTYFWIDGWAPVSASASAGPVTATVTATPLHQEWQVRDAVRGETEAVSCEGPGQPHDATEGAEEPRPACGWTPRHSSAGQPAEGGSADEPCFPTTVTVAWDVTWTSNLPGSGGELGAGTSSADVCLVVAEVQAVVSGDG
jgi:hypothetical protein